MGLDSNEIALLIGFMNEAVYPATILQHEVVTRVYNKLVMALNSLKSDIGKVVPPPSPPPNETTTRGASPPKKRE